MTTLQKSKIWNPLLDTMTCYMVFAMIQSTLQEYCAKLEIELATVSHIFLLTGLTTLASLVCAGIVMKKSGYERFCIIQYCVISDLRPPQIPCTFIHIWKHCHCIGFGTPRSALDQGWGCLQFWCECFSILCGPSRWHGFLLCCGVNLLTHMCSDFVRKMWQEYQSLSGHIW